MSTIKQADRIIVPKQGKVVETGNHETLLAMKEGVYSGLVLAQALSLGDNTDEKHERIEEALEPLNQEKTFLPSSVISTTGRSYAMISTSQV